MLRSIKKRYAIGWKNITDSLIVNNDFNNEMEQQ